MAKTIPTEELIETARSGSHGRKLEAVDALAQRVFRKKELREDDAVRGVLLEALASQDRDMRYFAASGLRYIDHPSVTDALIASLRSTVGNSLDTNLAIVERLGKSGDPRALVALQGLLADLPKGMPKAPVRDAIAKLELGARR